MRFNPRVLAGMALLGITLAGPVSCGYLGIEARCARTYPNGTEGYRECVRSEQAEAERLRERAARVFPMENVP